MGTRTSAPARRSGRKPAFFLLAGAAVAVSYFAMSSMPAFSADEGTVHATVTVEASCITVAPETVDFGGALFSTPSSKRIKASTSIGFTICGPTSNVLARGTNASGPAGTTASWSLEQLPEANGNPNGNPCDLPAPSSNKYGIEVQGDDGTGAGFTPLGTLTTVDKPLSSFVPGSATLTRPVAFGPGRQDVYTAVALPCSGSSGAGQQMSFQIIFTAVL